MKLWLVSLLLLEVLQCKNIVILATPSPPAGKHHLPSLAEDRGKQIRQVDSEQGQQMASLMTSSPPLQGRKPHLISRKEKKIDMDPTLTRFIPPAKRIDESTSKYNLRLSKARSSYKILLESKAEIAKYFPHETEETISQIFIGYLRDKKTKEDQAHNVNKRRARHNDDSSMEWSEEKKRREKEIEKSRLAKEAQKKYMIRTLLKKDYHNQDLWKQANELGITPTNLYVERGRLSHVDERVREYLVKIGLISKGGFSESDFQMDQATPSATDGQDQVEIGSGTERGGDFNVKTRGPRSEGRRPRRSLLAIDQNRANGLKEKGWHQSKVSPTSSSSSWGDATVSRKRRTKTELVNLQDESDQVDVMALRIPTRPRTKLAEMTFRRDQARQKQREREQRTRDMMESIFGKD